MNYRIILNDTLIGTITFSLVSYLNQLYKDSDDIVRVFAFLWATPLLYFFFINMFKNRKKQSIIEFSKHALLGVLCTVIAILLTMSLINILSHKQIVIFNFVYATLITFLYFYFQLYKKI